MGDEDDPDLLSELKELAIDDDEAPPPPPRAARPAPPPPGAPTSGQSSTISLLQDRISNYAMAEKAAKECGESSKARRFGRGLKTLNDLLKQAKAGRPVKDEDIPPPASIGKPAPPPEAPIDPEPVAMEPEPVSMDPEPSAPEPEEPLSLPEPSHPPPPPPNVEEVDPEKQEGLNVILKRKEEFKLAALSAKRAGDKTLALEFLKVVKQFDLVVDAYKAGQEMDLNELPTPQMIEAAVKGQKEESQVQTSEEPAPAPPTTDSEGLITASTVDEALRQRLAAFQQQEAKAKEDGNSSKARRLGRVIKQYQDAIRLNAAGKPIAGDELPTPAGYAPLPTGGSPAAAPAPAPRAPAPTPPSPAPSRGSQATPPSRHDKQLALLLHRQKQFREAAIKAKKAGDIEQAKEYLRAAKGFDSVIEAAKGGLVVDLKSLPLPPRAHKQLENTFDIVSAEDCGPSDEGPSTITMDDEDVLSRLHNQLTAQLKLCLSNRDHNKAMGHIAEANRFEHIAVSVKQDLDVVAVAKSLGQNPPKFHYESRQFSIVQCNTDINENELELTIVRGIAYNVPNPKEIDTYVKFEFPFPQDAPVSDRTALVKDTNSPEYNARFSLAIQRGARPCLRVFKRHAIKLEVYSRGCALACADALWCCSGWFRSDALLGSAAVKLAPLETQVTLHEAFPLMDGRRPAGGSIEVKLRVRTPLLQQQVEQSTHRWLVIDN
ncbi:coiled-coil and C2 domain-containing protein 1-like [Ostrinia furnacalis]|uniref:coiled-coil and C2 domain-containing protein 1-like n=1 Tax=Ostrinia furnacalis TaxID=93504 RepID=UPI00103E2A48|nr:coiled-coil and C2 domain-containing protein 1-like [Ostrinia furnacalis]